jgi:hypothetical protein
MIKKTITYTDLDGNQVTEDLYFNIYKHEAVEMHTSGFAGLLGELIKPGASEDAKLKMFKKILGMSYGERSEDGRRFKKSDEITADFLNSSAYDALFHDLATGTDQNVIDLIRGMLPKDMAGDVMNEAGKMGLQVAIPITDVPSRVSNIPIPEPKNLEGPVVPEAFKAKNHPSDMSIEELQALIEKKRQSAG